MVLGRRQASPAPQLVAYLTRLFTDPLPTLGTYSDAQLNQGLWFMASNGCSDYMMSLLEPPAPWPERRAGIRALALLFERLFALRCSDHLGHVDEPGANPLNMACYMWWDLFPTWGRPHEAERHEVDAELLGVMKQVLALDSVACQESALHGLGHWQGHYPDLVRTVVDDYLAAQQIARPELREYALQARRGYVQ